MNEEELIEVNSEEFAPPLVEEVEEEPEKIEYTPERYEGLKEHYLKAEEGGDLMFVYLGKEYVTRYAKYLVQHLGLYFEKLK